MNHVILTKIGKDCQNREKLFQTPSSHFLLESSTSYLNDRKNFVERERSLRKTLQKVPLSLQRTIVRNGRARGGRKREPNSSKVLEFINFPRMQNELPFNKFFVQKIYTLKPQNEEISIWIALLPPQKALFCKVVVETDNYRAKQSIIHEIKTGTKKDSISGIFMTLLEI